MISVFFLNFISSSWSFWFLWTFVDIPTDSQVRCSAWHSREGGLRCGHRVVPKRSLRATWSLKQYQCDVWIHHFHNQIDKRLKSLSSNNFISFIYLSDSMIDFLSYFLKSEGCFDSEGCCFVGWRNAQCPWKWCLMALRWLLRGFPNIPKKHSYQRIQI